MTRRTLTIGLVYAGIQGMRTTALQAVSSASYGMDDLPTWEVVARDGQILWRVCGAGLCVESCCGQRALADFEALCLSKGITPPRGGPSLPQRGPDVVGDPGV